MAGPALTDVPDRYDVVFSLNDGTTYGFMYADSVESNLPFRTHKALYSYSPTFLERQNLSNTYGDNFQDFFLTSTQVDLSEGEGQKFFRVNDPDSVRKYWQGLNVDPLTNPGETTLTYALSSSASTLQYATPGADWYAVDGTNFNLVTSNCTVTSKGAHGATSPTDITTDQSNAYIAGSGGIRKVTLTGFTFSTFSATVVTKLAFLNNILYGYQASTDSLISFDSSGTGTTQFQWKNADGTTSQPSVLNLIPYGGSLYIIRQSIKAWELWVYDGAGCRLLASFPPNFSPFSAAVSQGIVYVAGANNINPAGSVYRSEIYYYVNGSIGKLWEAKTTSSSWKMFVAPFGDGIAFYDGGTGNIYQYSLSVGGFHCVANSSLTTQSGSNPSALIPTTDNATLLFLGGNGINVYQGSANYNSSGNIQTSQYDFDNTLTKVFRGVKVDADIPANTSIDIAYQLNGAGGTYTALQTGAVSGTEYLAPASTTGHSISVKVTLNSATGSATPTLKRIYIRAAPTLQQFRRREYLFDLAGGAREDLGKTSRRTRDMTAYPVDPITACNNLAKIATQVIPFTVADRFAPSGMTVIADLQQNQAGYDGFAIYEVRPNVFIGRINLREV